MRYKIQQTKHAETLPGTKNRKNDNSTHRVADVAVQSLFDKFYRNKNIVYKQ